MRVQPIAFLSYVHSDDAYGHITDFCGRLAAEVQAQLGEEFRIFQDRNDISWGQNWRQRIDEGVDAATFLVPVITPSYFNSDYCRNELERFLKHERKLKRKDLVLPVYYIEAPLLNDEERRRAHKLATAIASRQWVDWRDLRFEPYTSPEVGKALARMAVQVREALNRTAGGHAAAPAPAKRPRRALARRRPSGALAPITVAQEATPAGPEAGAGRMPAAKTEPPILVVSQMHRGDYATVSEAIAAAQPGTRVLIRPGHYLEGLVIDRPLEIVGDGKRDDIVVQARGADAVLFKTTMGRVANLTLRQAGGGKWFAVDVSQGGLELEDCDISSESLACVAVHGGADPRIRRNLIHDCGQNGVVVYEDALGVLEDNDIFGNARAGVEIRDGGKPTLRRNRIRDNEGGVGVHKSGFGVLEDNDISGSSLAGVEISEGGNATLRRNRVHDGETSGIFVLEGGLGVLEDNDIVGNGYAGVWVQSRGNPTLRRNRVNGNKREGIFVREGGGGTFEGNDLRANVKGPWFVSEDSLPNVRRSGNIEG